MIMRKCKDEESRNEARQKSQRYKKGSREGGEKQLQMYGTWMRDKNKWDGV